MSAPSFAPPPSTTAPTTRANPPYAGPARGSGATSAQVRVGPFVPAAQRPAAEASPVVGGVMATAGQVVQAMAEPAMAASSMEVPASIPPYRPLRPIPFAAPATRSPLYIPPVATPAGGPAVEDEGMIEPLLIHTAEFAIPSLAAGDRPHATATNELGDAAVVDASAEAKLPWIDAFLASTPAMPMVALAEPAQAEPIMAAAIVPEPVVADGVEAAAFEALPEAGTVEPILEVRVEPPATLDEATTVSEGADANVEATVAADEWPLEEAADEFRALRVAMDDTADRDAVDMGNGVATQGVVFAPLPEWRDDDLMDIMPIRHSGRTPLSNGALASDSGLWAERAHKAQEEVQLLRAMASAQSAQPEHTAAESTAEEAAYSLELLARRVRAGELTLPSYDPRMGEPAALVAALAALLGVKLR